MTNTENLIQAAEMYKKAGNMYEAASEYAAKPKRKSSGFMKALSRSHAEGLAKQGYEEEPDLEPILDDEGNVRGYRTRR